MRRWHLAWLAGFASASAGAGLGRAMTTSYVPVLLERIRDAPGLIGVVMLVNPLAGFAVPLAVGIWVDRRRVGGRNAARPLIMGGAAVTAGGLIAVALGTTSSYLVLAVFALVAYVGLNAVTTAHRVLVRQSFAPAARPETTSAQELALLIGGLAGVAAGGWMIEVSSQAAFLAAAAAVVVLALPTLRFSSESVVAVPMRTPRPPVASLVWIAMEPRTRAFLLAEVLWVLGYAALPAFFVLYAANVLEITAAEASVWLAGFGIATAFAVVGAGRVRQERLYLPLLLSGLACMGGGFALVGAASTLAAVGPALLLAGVGFGVVSALGYPVYSALIPDGEEGAYTALFFSARAVASAIALPLAGGAIALSGTYRALFVIATLATLASVIPLVGAWRVVRAPSTVTP